MINRKLLFITAIAFAIDTLSLCNNPSSSDGGGGDVIIADNYESDDTRNSAKSIKPDSIAAQKRTIKECDTDWVFFPAIAGRSYRIFTTGSTDTKIKVYSAIGTLPIAEGDDSPNNVNASVQFNCTSTGNYYACISGRTETVTGKYELAITTTIGPDSYEPDLTPLYSPVITTSSGLSRTIESGDIDWVKFYVSAGDTVLLKAKCTSSVLMTLFDIDSVSTLANSKIVDSSAQIKFFIPETGTYFVKITGQNASSTGSYQLTLQTASSGTLVITDIYENDNSISTAKVISKNSTIQERSLSVGDTDWVILPVEAGCQYLLYTESNSTASSDVYAIMYLKNGEPLEGPSSLLTFNCSANDSVFVKIYSFSTVAINYNLKLNVFLQPSISDRYEVDNTKAQAKYFASDSLEQDRTLPVINSIADSDWVAFPVYVGKKYSIQAYSSSSTYKPYIYLYNKSSTSSVGYSSVGSITYNPTVSDTMYLFIRYSESVSIAYTLSIYGEYENDSFEPDSSRLTADSITTEVGVQERILLPGDTDWVKFTVTPGDSIAILTTGTTDTKIALFSSSGITPEKQNDDISTTNANACVSMKSVYGGLFYICVTGKTTSTSGSYTLQVLSTSAGTLVAADSFENDNSKASATLIKDTTFSGHTHSITMNDTDWISFPVLAGGSYTVSASNQSSYWLTMIGYRSDDSLVGIQSSYINPIITFTSTKNDTVYFCITSSSTIGKYSISMSRVAPPPPDVFENDNTRALAKVKTDTVLSAEVHSLSVVDTDWVAFPVLAGGSYTFTISSTSNSVSTYYYKADGTLINYRSSTSSIISYTPTVNDTIFFRMTSSYSVPYYTISMSRTAPLAPDAFENDNTKAMAKFKIDTVLNAEIHSLSVVDTDWVAFPVLADGSYSFTISSTSGSVTTYYYRANGLSIDYRTGTSYTISYTPTVNDTIYFRMTAASVSVPRYTLSMSRIAPLPPDSYESDNTRSTAKILPTDSTIQKRNLTSNDIDYMSFRGNAGDKIVFRASQLAANSSIIRIYDSLGTLQTSKVFSNAGLILPYNLRKTGIHYASIEKSATTVTRYEYSIAAVLHKIDSIAADTSLTRSILANVSDTQLVAVSLDSGKSYSFRSSGLNVRMLLHRSLTTTSSLQTADGTNATFSYDCTQTGIYIIKVCGYGSSYAGDFTLSVTEVDDAVGKWDVSYSWNSGSTGSIEFELSSNGNFSDGSYTGEWVRNGNVLAIEYSSGTLYTGTITGETITGTMTASDGSTGTWTGTKQ